MPPEKTDTEKAEVAKAAEADVVEKTPEKKEPDPADKEFDKDRALATIRTQREAENKLKAEVRELRDVKAEFDKIKEKDLSEKERLEKRVSEMEGKVTAADDELKEARLLRAVTRAKVSVVDSDAAVTFLKDRIEYEGGKPKGVEDALKALLEEKPYLKGKPSAPSVDGGSGGEQARASLTAEQAQMAQMFGMKPEEYAAWTNKSDIPDVSKPKE
ncbi:MAG: hypothetical protein Q8R92_05400 [Deltaproteobacteria bacterium]|nr:hypothetical protein [Deltaproteobacteria bacterium]